MFQKSEAQGSFCLKKGSLQRLAKQTQKKTRTYVYIHLMLLFPVFTEAISSCSS
jgi:hypothetical protein